MPVLAVLRHEEGVRLNPDALVALYAELGDSGAERVLGRALEDLSAHLSEAMAQFGRAEPAALARSARRIATIAEQVGMATLARVARDVVRTSEAADAAGQAATVARLARTGERSFAALWDLHETGG